MNGRIRSYVRRMPSRSMLTSARSCSHTALFRTGNFLHLRSRDALWSGLTRPLVASATHLPPRALVGGNLRLGSWKVPGLAPCRSCPPRLVVLVWPGFTAKSPFAPRPRRALARAYAAAGRVRDAPPAARARRGQPPAGGLETSRLGQAVAYGRGWWCWSGTARKLLWLR